MKHKPISKTVRPGQLLAECDNPIINLSAELLYLRTLSQLIIQGVTAWSHRPGPWAVQAKQNLNAAP